MFTAVEGIHSLHLSRIYDLNVDMSLLALTPNMYFWLIEKWKHFSE